MISKKVLCIIGLIVVLLVSVCVYLIYQTKKDNFYDISLPLPSVSTRYVKINAPAGQPINIAGVFIYDQNGNNLITNQNTAMANASMNSLYAPASNALKIIFATDSNGNNNVNRKINDAPLNFGNYSYNGLGLSQSWQNINANIAHSYGGGNPFDYWQYDFGSDINISAVEIYTRTDCCPERNTNLTVQVISNNGNKSSLNTSSAFAPVIISTVVSTLVSSTTSSTTTAGATSTTAGMGSTTTTAGATSTMAGMGATTSTMAGMGATTSTMAGTGATTFTMAGMGATTSTMAGMGATTSTMAGIGATTTTAGATTTTTGATTSTMAGTGATTTTTGATTSTMAGTSATTTTTGATSTMAGMGSTTTTTGTTSTMARIGATTTTAGTTSTMAGTSATTGTTSTMAGIGATTSTMAGMPTLSMPSIPQIPIATPGMITNLLNNGIGIDYLTSQGIGMNGAYRGPSTNIVQTNFSGTSNVYSPFLYYNKGSSEKFIGKLYHPYP